MAEIFTYKVIARKPTYKSFITSFGVIELNKGIGFIELTEENAAALSKELGKYAKVIKLDDDKVAEEKASTTSTQATVTTGMTGSIDSISQNALSNLTKIVA